MRIDGQKDMAKLIIAFRSFAKAPKKYRKVAVTCFCSNLPPFRMNLLQIPLTMWGEPCSRKMTQERLTEPLKCESPKLVPLPCDNNNGFNGV